MASIVIPVVTELIDHDHGHWCPTCALSTGIRAWVTVRIGSTGRMTLQQRTWCTECGARDTVVSDDGRHC